MPERTSSSFNFHHEFPWHIRVATLEHQVRFRKLADFQDLTHAWLADLQVDRSTHFMDRGTNPEISKNLWLLDSLAHRDPGSLLEDSYPDEMLSRLCEMVYAVQAWTLQSLLDRTPANDRAALISILEQSSWKTGRSFSEKIAQKGTLNPTLSRSELLIRLACAPIFPLAGTDNFLVRRSTSLKVQVELQSCPHQLEYDEIHGHKDLLCRLHYHWARGFSYALNPELIIDYHPAKSISPSARCRLEW
jgi:hypothetical protein